MAIDFATTFGRNAGNSNGRGKPQDDRPRAQYWLNIGYTLDVTVVMTDGPDEGKLVTETRFVSLPTGIPLDTQNLLDTKSQNTDYANFQAARNDLLEQVLSVCKDLEPGEEKIIGMGDSGLSIQLRRIMDEKPVVKAADNQFVKRLAFA